VATLQTIPADNGSPESDAGKVGGFSLHAGVAAEAHERQKLEHLCRYIARPDAKLSEQLPPSGRGKRPPPNVADDKPPEPADNRTPIERRRAMTLSAAPQARLQHRREHVRPLWRRATERGQHRRTHRHPRHPRPLRKTRRA